MGFAFVRRKTWVALALVMALAASAIAPASAAEEAAAQQVVTALELENDSDVHLYVDHDTYQLKALATVQGASAKKDVTASAVWASTSSSIVKVDKGKLTPVGAGTAKVSAKYEGKTVYASVTVEYMYDAVRLSEDGPATVELRDEPIRLTAQAVESNGTAFDVTTAAVWSSSDASVATVDGGKVKLLKKGTATITAKYKGRSDSIVYNVTSPYKSLALEYDGGSEFEFVVDQAGVEFEAIAALIGGSFEDVTEEAKWTSSNGAVAAVEGGKLTFKSAGVAEIAASRFGHEAKATVVVRLPYQALLLSPSKPQYLFVSDAPVQAKAEVANDFSSRIDVTSAAAWTTSDPLVVTAQGGLIRPRGVGEAEVTVTYKGLSKKMKVVVMPVVNGLALDETEVTLYKGEVTALPDVYGEDLNGTEVSFADIAEWSSADETVATIENGKLKAKKPGETTVTMTIRGETDTLKVKVLEKALALLPSAAAMSLVKGETAPKPTVKAVLENGVEIDVSNDIEWETSSPNLLLADSTVKGLLPAKVTLTGTYLNKKVSIPVTIEDRMTNVTVDPAEIELNPGRSKTIKVTGKDSTGKSVTLTNSVQWTSSAPSVAAASGSSVKAVSAGSATLSATYQGQTLNVKVAVVPKLQKVELSEKSLKLTSGGAQRLQLIAYYDDGTTKDVTAQAVWSSSNVSVATVSAGRVTGLKKGSAAIKAKFGSKTASAKATVSP
ncbi:Ig-like domain-containing protein [Paenibacillus sp.]|uniref:Ig-like domain-containing protein n=1 Tax=Paenibacillus sp. TaxID=58172 RepID=UPI002D39C4F9|nr:Ig-like domain-containing protein [Paenibacillus sp.]HZG85016.1 Ig-like domain-containing protein [Paenibacillus sp.]